MPKKKKKMSYERRRRQDRSRKRIFRGSQSDLSPMNGNHGNYVSKAYAINEFNFEDLDRMIMFITESKQIQGRYYVRYLPGMLNSAGELTPCNYRPVFSFTSTAAPSEYNFLQNNDYSDGSPEIVDLTDSDGISSENSNPASPASPSTVEEEFKAYTQEKHIEADNTENGCGESGERKDSKSETPGAEKENVSKSVPGFLSTINRKQTARKSMRQQTESLSCGTENSISPAVDMETENSSVVSTSNSDSVNINIRSKSTNSSINKNNLVANSSLTSNCKSKLPSDKWDILDGVTVTMNPDFR